MKTIFTFSLCLIYYITACQTFVINKHQEIKFQNHIKKLQNNPNNKRLTEAIEKQTAYFYSSFSNDFYSDLKFENYIDWNKNLNKIIIVKEKLTIANTILPNSLSINQTILMLNATKQLIADSVYNHSTNLISYNERFKYIEANNLLSKLRLISPDYKNINELIELTEKNGKVNMCVKIENNSGVELNEDILQNIINIDSLNLVSKWTKYTFCESENQDYQILFTINIVSVLPEKISTFKTRKIKFKRSSFYDRNFYSMNSSFDKLFFRNNINDQPNYYENERVLFFAVKEAILTGNISVHKSFNENFIRPFIIKSIYNYKWDSKYGNILKQDPFIIPSNEEMVSSVFKQFRNVIDKEHVLTTY